MKFLKVLDIWAPPPSNWQAILEPKETVVTANGQPLAILSAFDAAQMADTLSAFRMDQARDAFVSIQYRSVQTGTNLLTAEEIQSKINAGLRDGDP